MKISTPGKKFASLLFSGERRMSKYLPSASCLLAREVAPFSFLLSAQSHAEASAGDLLAGSICLMFACASPPFFLLYQIQFQRR